MASVVLTNAPAVVAVPVLPTPHPGAKYAKTYKKLGVRNIQLPNVVSVLNVCRYCYNAFKRSNHQVRINKAL